MSKFSKIIFVCYILTLTIAWLINIYLYWTIIIGVLFLQVSNIVLRKWVDNKTKYKDSLSHEGEKLRLIYSYFGFPFIVMFPKRFREIRKYSYYERRVKEIEETKKLYEKHNIVLEEDIKNEWIICNRYLKLKKLKDKDKDIRVDIEETARIYFNEFLVRLLDNYFYFQMSDDTRAQLIVEAISTFQNKYTHKKFPYGHNIRKSTDNIIDFYIHFNYKDTEHYMDITMYPKLVQRRLKLNKILKK